MLTAMDFVLLALVWLTIWCLVLEFKLNKLKRELDFLKGQSEPDRSKWSRPRSSA
jgi:hypothetical protein